MNWKSVSDEPEYNKTILLAWPEKRFAGESWWAKGHFDEDGWKDEDNYPLPEPPTHWFLITPPSEPDPSAALAEALEELVAAFERPSRQFLDSTRQEVAPWLVQARAALAIHRKATT